MHLQLSTHRICYAAAMALFLVIVTSVSADGQEATPPKDIEAFFQDTVGEWIGTVEQYTGKVKADTKYFHATVQRTSSDTYEATFEYYRLDKATRAPVQVGITKMTNKITKEGVATNTITGKGDVFIKPGNSKPEEHTLSEVLQMTPTGSLEGKGSGRISVSGIALGAGKNGKVSDYTSTWGLDSGILKITERLKVTFRVLFFAQRYDIVDNFEGKRGSDIVGLMKTAEANLSSASPTPSH